MSISRRERIIIALALLAALYAGGQYLLTGSSRQQVLSPGEDKPAGEFLAEVAQSIAGNRLTETEEAILAKAGAPWPAQPFLQTGTSSLKAGDPSSQTSGELPAGLSYTGYIEAGSRRLAIINGAEYEPGDPLRGALLMVRSISSEQVFLEDAEGRGYSVPLQDEPGPGSATMLLKSEE